MQEQGKSKNKFRFSFKQLLGIYLALLILATAWFWQDQKTKVLEWGFCGELELEFSVLSGAEKEKRYKALKSLIEKLDNLGMSEKSLVEKKR